VPPLCGACDCGCLFSACCCAGTEGPSNGTVGVRPCGVRRANHVRVSKLELGGYLVLGHLQIMQNASTSLNVALASPFLPFYISR
jgi:hypothetical protein